MTTTSYINQVEADAVRALCRQPGLVVNISEDTLDEFIQGGLPHRIASAMVGLHAKHLPVSLQTVGERAGIDITELRILGNECTIQMLESFAANLEVIRKYGLRRRMASELKQSYDRVMSADPMNIDETAYEVVSDISSIQRAGGDTGTIEVNEIIREYYSLDPETALWRIPTGFHGIDRLTDGGIARNEMWVIFGPFKQGKTQVTRVCLANMARNLTEMGSDRTVIHIAHDGGNKYRHANYYLSMECLRNAMLAGVELNALAKQENGMFSEEPIITANRIEKIIRGYKMDMEIPRATLSVILDTYALVGEHGLFGGRLRVYDTKTIRKSLRRLIAILQREHVQNGMQIFAVDHGGEFGDPGIPIFERTEAMAGAIAGFTEENDVASIVLSQVSREGQNVKLRGYNSMHRGGDALAQKCSLDLEVGRQDQNNEESDIRLTVRHSRFTKQGNHVEFFFQPHLHAGFVLERE